jgi:hypothetical protein
LLQKWKNFYAQLSIACSSTTAVIKTKIEVLKLYTIKNIHDGIDKKIESMRDGTEEMDAFCTLCKAWMENYPSEVEQNILEWINNIELSDIECHGTSIKRVMNTMDLTDDAFPMVIRNFKIFKERNFEDGTYICYMNL